MTSSGYSQSRALFTLGSYEPFFPDSHITYQIGIRKVTTWVRGFKEVPPAHGLRAKKSSDELRQEEGRGENVQVMELLREGIVAGCPDCEQTQGGWRRKRREALWAWLTC